MRLLLSRTIFGSLLVISACTSAQQLPAGIDPAKREWYGEFYNPEEYSKCKAKDRNPANIACDYLRLVREEEPEFWPYPNVPKPKLPDPPNPAVYRSGMTSKEYFDALCKVEAGEFIYKVVESVEGVYQIRPRKKASWQAIMDRYVMEDPYGYTSRRRDRPAARAKSHARRAASSAPSADRRRSHANPHAPSTSTRTPTPSLSTSSIASTRPFFVATDWLRRTIARASAYSAPAA